MNYYDKNWPYIFSNEFNKTVLSLFIISIILFIFSIKCNSLIFFSKWFLLFALNCFFDIVINACMGFFWGHKSMYELKVVKKNYRDRDRSKVNLLELREASWQPRIVGILERIIMTVSFVTNKYELAAGWLVFKIVRIHKDREGNNQKNSLWRITENIFIMGTGLSILSSLIMAQIYSSINW